jgi:hypothetical protein
VPFLGALLGVQEGAESQLGQQEAGKDNSLFRATSEGSKGISHKGGRVT